MPFLEQISGILSAAAGSFMGNSSGNAPVLLMLGGFKFSINTAAFTELQRSTSYKWPAQERMGQYDALQYTGPGEDRITLPGIIFPDWKGGNGQLNNLRALAAQGRPLQLISSTGMILGAWVIEHVDEGQSFYKPDGTFRRQEFNVTIRKYGDASL